MHSFKNTSPTKTGKARPLAMAMNR